MRRDILAFLTMVTSGCVVTLPARAPPPAASEYRAAPPAAEYRAPLPEASPPAQSWTFRCPHPMPASAGGGYCPVPVVHEHPFPADPAWEPGPDGACAPAPASYGYEGVHPIPAGGWCDLTVLHVHDFAPILGLAWTSPTPGVFVYAGGDVPRFAPPSAPPPPPPDAAALRAAERAEDVAETLETAGKVVKTVGKVGKAIGKGTLKYLKGLDKKGDSSSSSGSRSTGHHHGGGGHHGGHH